MRTLSSEDGTMADRPTGRKAGALPPAAMYPYKAVTKGGNGMEEIWKDIQEYEGLYQVSNLGNVRSMNYQGTKGKIQNLRFKTNKCGRLWVLLYRDGRGKPMLVHRLVGAAFIPNPDSLPQINHKDENPQNNIVENLEWCTNQYNVQYTVNRHPEWFRNGGNPGRPRNGKYKQYPVNQLDANGNIIKKWPNARTIFVQTGMSDWSISECCRGNRKKAYGFRWQYAI